MTTHPYGLRKMIRIHIGSITEQGLTLDARADANALPLLQAIIGEGTIAFTRSVHVQLRATLSGETVVVDGGARATIRIPCSRCLESFVLTIENDFSLTAVPDTSATNVPGAEDEVELAAADMNVIAYSGDSIDLGDEIAQQIIMALPFKPLCSETCMGLCKRCGVDLNKAPCQCHPAEQETPFSVLKTLSLPKAGE